MGFSRAGAYWSRNNVRAVGFSEIGGAGVYRKRDTRYIFQIALIMRLICPALGFQRRRSARFLASHSKANVHRQCSCRQPLNHPGVFDIYKRLIEERRIRRSKWQCPANRLGSSNSNATAPHRQLPVMVSVLTALLPCCGLAGWDRNIKTPPAKSRDQEIGGASPFEMRLPQARTWTRKSDDRPKAISRTC